MKYRNLWLGLIFVLAVVEAAYVVAFKTQTLLPFFDIDGEANFPTWVSSTLFSLAGFFASGNYLLNNKGKMFWLVLSLCCLFVSMDEVAQVHEKISILTGIKWVYFYGPIGTMVILFLAVSAYNQWAEQSTTKLIMVGVILGFVVSVGLETLSYFGLTSLWQKIEYMLEEGAEILGAGIILLGCLQEMGNKVTFEEY